LCKYASLVRLRAVECLNGIVVAAIAARHESHKHFDPNPLLRCPTMEKTGFC
jgi:hypothetical protein